MMCLALRVEAALMEGDFLPNYVSVSVPEPGKVRLSGVVQVPWEKTNVERLLSKVKGVESLDNQIEIASATEAK
jgi:osmotically-inducible protein OsmY